MLIDINVEPYATRPANQTSQCEYHCDSPQPRIVNKHYYSH